ncbi:MAG: hypothetical protein KDD62_08660, partial [Bdellovibrionales bacterium]|nr:hypothetical protein [Bdellovibrionales bacterium]
MTEDLLAHPPSNELQLILTEIFLGFQLTYLLSSYLALRGYSLKWFPIKERHFTGFWIIWLGLGLAISQVLGTSYLTLSMLFAGVILVTVLSPVLAVSIFLSVFLLRPWELVVRPSEIMNFIPKVLAVTCLGSCILHAAFRYSKRITWNLPLLLFSALFVCLFGSACFSGDIKGGLDYLFRHFYPIVVIMLLVTNLLENDKALKIVGTSIALSVCGVVITAFAETFFGPFNTAYEYRLHTSSFWGNPNDLGALILMALPFVVFPMILRAKSMEQLFIGLGMACTLLAGLVSTQSRGALLACFLACVVYLITGKGKRIILLSVGSLFVAAALGFIVMRR